MSVIKVAPPEGHTPHSDCWCYPTISQYEDGKGAWHTLVVHDVATEPPAQ